MYLAYNQLFVIFNSMQMLSKISLFSVLILFSLCCFAQDCELTEEILAKKPDKENACFEYAFLPDQFRRITEPLPPMTPEEEEEAAFKCIPTIVRKELYKPAHCAWVEAFCEDKITSEMYIEIKKALRARGYDSGNLDPKRDETFMKALFQFLKDNELPQIPFSKDTMYYLGLSEKK